MNFDSLEGLSFFDNVAFIDLASKPWPHLVGELVG